MRILHITSILPAPLKRKETENDILIRIAEELEKTYPDSKHYFILCLPYSNSILANFKSRWKEYYDLIKKGFYEYHGFKIYVIGIPAFATDQIIRKQLSWLGYLLNKGGIKNVLNQVKPDKIHAHNLKGNIELAEIIKNKFGFNYVVTARNLGNNSINKLQNGEFIPTKILSLNYRNYEISKNNLKIPVDLIPHPVDDEFFVDSESLNVKEKPKFISVCRLLELKNIDKVLQALLEIKLPYVYDIYGSGPEMEKLKRMVDKLSLQSKINFKGQVPHNEIKKAMKEYDLLLQPSFPETLGRVYFEAMASGVPVIASKNTGIDGLINSGQEGYLVNHYSIEEISSSIYKYLNLNKKEKIKLKKGVINKVSNYRWSKTLLEYHKFYEL